MPTAPGGTAASEWQIGDLLTRGVAKNIPIAAGQTLVSKDVDTAGENEMAVMYEMTGGASADLTVQVQPFKTDGVTPLANVTLTPISSNGPTFGGGVVQYQAVYDVSAYAKVRITAKNSNAGAQTINEFSYRFSGN
jgi:hypothetical protein